MSLVAQLIECGTPPELVEEVAMLLAEKRVAEKAITERRARDAERQARKRERDADNVTSRDVTDCHGDPSLSLPPNEKNNSNPPAHTHPENTPRARKADDFPRPDWAEPQVWRDLLKNRKTKRLPNTATAYAAFVATVEGLAEDGWPPGEVLRAIVAKGWGGAHDPRDDRKPGNGQAGKQRFEGNRTLRELAERSIAGG